MSSKYLFGNIFSGLGSFADALGPGHRILGNFPPFVEPLAPTSRILSGLRMDTLADRIVPASGLLRDASFLPIEPNGLAGSFVKSMGAFAVADPVGPASRLLKGIDTSAFSATAGSTSTFLKGVLTGVLAAPAAPATRLLECLNVGAFVDTVGPASISMRASTMGLVEPIRQPQIFGHAASRVDRLDFGASLLKGFGALAVLADSNFGERLHVPQLGLRSIFSSSATTSDMAHDADVLVDALRALATEAILIQERDGSAKDPREDTTPPPRDENPTPNRIIHPASALHTPSQRARQEVPLRSIRAFLGSATADERSRDALMKHLSMIRHSGLITIWHDGDMAPGDDRATITRHQLERSSLILLLITADYIAELYDRGLMHDLEARSQRIIPILVSPVDYDYTFLAKISPLPTDGTPVTMWDQPEAAWTDVARGVRATVESIRQAALRMQN